MANNDQAKTQNSFIRTCCCFYNGENKGDNGNRKNYDNEGSYYRTDVDHEKSLYQNKCVVKSITNSFAYCSWPSINEDPLVDQDSSEGASDFVESGLYQAIRKSLTLPQPEGYFGKTCVGIKYLNQCFVFKQWHYQIVIKARKNLRQGAMRLSKLEHRNVIRVLQFYLEFNGVVEESGAESLSDRMIDMNPNRLLGCYQRHVILSNVVEGLSYLHSKEIVHNNLTGKNIILTSDGTAKITHGGYYTVFPEAISNIKVDGFKNSQNKLGYYSSNAYNGIVEKSNDIFSLGAVIFLLLCGKEPYLCTENGKDVDARSILQDKKKRKTLKDKRIKWAKNPQLSTTTYRKCLVSIAKNCMKEKLSERLSIYQIKKTLRSCLDIYFSGTDDMLTTGYVSVNDCDDE
ncbi:Protein LYK5 [Trichoplax sp. H2]|nr:Protein LYK5 [Trichoplax sp. H2]|eukprot:RDD39269.1 Protein LYK5 [Trichoplax sp. H2]